MTSPEFFLLLLNNIPLYIFALLIVTCVSLLLSRICIGTIINGMMLHIYYLVASGSVAVFLFLTTRIDGIKFFHFIIIELSIAYYCFFLFNQAIISYDYCLWSLPREKVRKFLLIFFIVSGALSLYSFFMQTAEDSSRIEFMYISPSWAYIKHLVNLATPFGYFAPWLVLLKKLPRKYFIVSILLIILNSMATGSKAGFIMILPTTYLCIREMPHFKTRISAYISKLTLAVAGVIVIAGMLANLLLLNVDFFYVLNRAISSGDAIYLSYPLEDPTQFLNKVDILTKYHRGLSRFIGFQAGRDSETEFGVSMTRFVENDTAFRGPNARVSAFALCNFGVLGSIPFLLYVFIVLYFQYALVRQITKFNSAIGMILWPYLLFSLFSSAQDFSLSLTNLSFLLVFYLGHLSWRIWSKCATQ